MTAWIALLDEWWDRQSATLPDGLRRTLQATLDQSKAVWAIAGGLPADGPDAAEPGTGPGIMGEPTNALWRPVLEALRACERNVLSERLDPQPSHEYASAYGAYIGELTTLNAEVARRINDRLARLDTDVGFVGLHRMFLEEAEEAYLAHVSTEDFARCQARYVNALFRYALMSRDRPTQTREES